MDVAAARLQTKDIARAVVIAVVLAVFALAMAKDVRVPLLSLVDLGFHELGHLLTYVFPDLVTAMAGSVAQVAVPFGLSAYFFGFQADLGAVALCLGWAGTAAYDAARYIADAPYERLELLGGGEHDWAFALTELNQIHNAGTLATVVRIVGWLVLAAGAALLVRRYAWEWLREA